MKHTPFTTDPHALVQLAGAALLRQEPVCMTLPAGWTRPRGFPLPMAADKTTRDRQFRPIAVLEWVNDELSGANATKKDGGSA